MNKLRIIAAALLTFFLSVTAARADFSPIPGNGTVTSVAMTGDGTIFNSTVTGSPVTTGGTLAPSLISQSAHVALIGPTSSSAAPTFRLLVVGDLPSSVVTSTGNLAPLFTSSISAQALSFSLSNASAHTFLGNNTGSTGAPGYVSIGTGDLPAAIVYNNQANTYTTGIQDFSAATQLKLPTIADPASTAGSGWINSTLLKYWDNQGTPAKHTVATIDLTNGFTANQVPSSAGGVSLGTNALPWSSLYVGGAATNNNQITSAVTTAARTFTLPDANSNSIVPSSAAAHQFATAVSSGGVITWTQPAFTDVSGTATAGQLPSSVVTSTGNLSPIFTSSISAQALSFTLSNASANTALRGPTSGAAAAPTYRTDVDADMPQDAVLFGGPTTSTYRQLPTSGTLTGEYWYNGNYTTTGSITCNRCIWHVNGNVTISNAVTCNTELAGAPTANSNSSVNYVFNAVGMGLGGGYSGQSNTAVAQISGGGGGHGGAGGHGGCINAPYYPSGGGIYYHEHMLAGSGGGSGSSGGAETGAGAGGNGGGSLIIESVGNVSIGANVSANGAAGGNATINGASGGGGGSGGGIDIRATGTVTINASQTVSANGGAGGNWLSTGSPNQNDPGGGGGGGGIIFIRAGSTYTNNGTVQCLGGAAGSSGSSVTTYAATAGSAGTVDAAGSSEYGVRLGL